MAFVNPTAPNLADFETFLTTQGVPYAGLSDPAFVQYALDYAQNVALLPPADMPAILYVLAVYNLGTHRLIRIGPDATGQTWFSTARAQYKLLSFGLGPVVASADQGTSQTLAQPEWFKGMTISALDLAKTPWGVEYLDYAQQYGPNIVGLS